MDEEALPGRNRTVPKQVTSQTSRFKNTNTKTKANFKRLLREKGYVLSKDITNEDANKCYLCIQLDLPVFIPNEAEIKDRPVGDYTLSKSDYEYSFDINRFPYRYANVGKEILKIIASNLSTQRTGKPLWCQESNVDVDYLLFIIALLDKMLYKTLKTSKAVEISSVKTRDSRILDKATEEVSISKRIIESTFMRVMGHYSRSIRLTRDMVELGEEICSRVDAYKSSDRATTVFRELGEEFKQAATNLMNLREIKSAKENFCSKFQSDNVILTPAPRRDIDATESDASIGRSILSIAGHYAAQSPRITKDKFPVYAHPDIIIEDVEVDRKISHQQLEKAESMANQQYDQSRDLDKNDLKKDSDPFIDRIIDELDQCIRDKAQLSVDLCRRMVDTLWTYSPTDETLVAETNAVYSAQNPPPRLLVNFKKSGLFRTLSKKEVPKVAPLPKRSELMADKAISSVNINTNINEADFRASLLKLSTENPAGNTTSLGDSATTIAMRGVAKLSVKSMPLVVKIFFALDSVKHISVAISKRELLMVLRSIFSSIVDAKITLKKLNRSLLSPQVIAKEENDAFSDMCSNSQSLALCLKVYLEHLSAMIANLLEGTVTNAIAGDVFVLNSVNDLVSNSLIAIFSALDQNNFKADEFWTRISEISKKNLTIYGICGAPRGEADVSNASIEGGGLNVGQAANQANTGPTMSTVATDMIQSYSTIGLRLLESSSEQTNLPATNIPEVYFALIRMAEELTEFLNENLVDIADILVYNSLIYAFLTMSISLLSLPSGIENESVPSSRFQIYVKLHNAYSFVKQRNLKDACSKLSELPKGSLDFGVDKHPLLKGKIRFSRTSIGNLIEVLRKVLTIETASKSITIFKEKLRELGVMTAANDIHSKLSSAYPLYSNIQLDDYLLNYLVIRAGMHPVPCAPNGKTCLGNGASCHVGKEKFLKLMSAIVASLSEKST